MLSRAMRAVRPQSHRPTDHGVSSVGLRGLQFLIAVLLVLLLGGLLTAQEISAEAPRADTTEPLVERQRQVAERYDKLEQILLRMSELSAASDPRRAALLKKAVAESKEKLIGVQFASLVDQLNKDQLAKALDTQEKLDGDLTKLLQLLLSENRSTRLASEKVRIRQYLQQLNRIINQQKGLQARTTGGTGRTQELSGQQGELGESTEELAEEIRRNEEQARDDDGKAPGAPSEPPDAEKVQESNEPSPGGTEKTPDGDNTPKDGTSDPRGDEAPSEDAGDSAKPSEESGNPQTGEAQPSDGSQSTPQQDSDEAHPARQRLDAARQRMRQAQQKLNDAEREGAADDQEEAIRELQQAKAELEDILRQLREEEIEQVLVALEARVVKMLQMQREVYEGTERLDKASVDGLSHEQEIEAGRLSTREAEIVLEADKALILLREDGTSVAMPEALSQAREDMQQVVARLGRAKVGKITLAIEEDIVVALEEMLEAVRHAMEDAEQRRQDSQQGQPGMPQEPALVDALAELRMIRSLQLRVNKRTERYGQLISGKHAETPELIEALQQLAERQDRVYQITTDLESGKNR